MRKIKNKGTKRIPILGNGGNRYVISTEDGVVFNVRPEGSLWVCNGQKRKSIKLIKAAIEAGEIPAEGDEAVDPENPENLSIPESRGGESVEPLFECLDPCAILASQIINDDLRNFTRASKEDIFRTLEAGAWILPGDDDSLEGREKRIDGARVADEFERVKKADALRAASQYI